jgi:hypothetical protein
MEAASSTQLYWNTLNDRKVGMSAPCAVVWQTRIILAKDDQFQRAAGLLNEIHSNAEY